MGRVVAIAGGDLLSTRKLNVHAITLSNKTTPNVLLIGTASHDAEGYIDAITKEYNQLNCEVKSLCLVSGDQKTSMHFYPGLILSMSVAGIQFL